ncbi:MAG: ATP-binding cassette domain-containing protein [Burkholderiaceae bacterium]|nr:ATP-binding cassette domain-containing protein [Burkholderiaceae bacterium]
MIEAYLGECAKRHVATEETHDRRSPRISRPAGRLRRHPGGARASTSTSAQARLVALIGANGAGKTHDAQGASPGLSAVGRRDRVPGRDDHRRMAAARAACAQGWRMVPEGAACSPRMSVTENLLMGAFLRNDNAQVNADIDRMFQTFPRLKERSRQLAGTLSGGEQQMLAMARALMSQPKLLLLDEPSMGLAPIMVEKIFEVVRSVSAQKIPMLLVEQNARLALEAADRAYVMDSGLITLSGDAKSMLDDPKVRAAYLGEAH